jgi:hypothetical protein
MKRAAYVFCVISLASGCESTELSYSRGDVQLEQTTLDFGTVFIGHAETRQVQIDNRGGGPSRLVRSSITGADTFAVAELPEQIPAGAFGAVKLQFAPALEGSATATISIFDDAKDRPPLVILVFGTGTPTPACNDNNNCTDDTFDFNTETCVHTARTGACDDGSACTVDDVCVDRSCVGRAIACNDGIACTHDVCDAAIGCTVIPDHTACPDEDPCTIDQCTDQGCTHDDAPTAMSAGRSSPAGPRTSAS